MAPKKPLQEAEAKKVPERGEIDKKYLWATETIYPDKAAWDKEFGELEKKMGEIEKFKGTLSKGPEQMLGVLAWRDEFEPRLERVQVYSSLLADEDTRKDEGQKMEGRVRTLIVKYSAQTSWLVPEISDIPLDTIKEWMGKNEKLAMYRQFFDDLFRQKKHILPPREEELMALSGEVRGATGTAYNLLANADIKFPKIKDETGKEVELDDMAYYLYMRSSDRRFVLYWFV